MDGLALLSRVAELARPLKVVVVTAFSDLPRLRAAMNRGAFDFLAKPIDFDDLEATLYNALTAVDQQKRESFLRDALGRYLSPEIALALQAGPEALKLGGERRTVTMLMSDLRGFTTLAEGLPPEQVVHVLNVYLGEMAEVISRRGGTIDEFIGDATFAIFGAPFTRPDDAARAVACAIEMQQAMSVVNTRVAELGLPPLEMGIGINTGEVVVGNIGSHRRAKYGVVGGPVNLTSRIESYSIGGQVLVSESTRRAAGGSLVLGRSFPVSAKGLQEPLLVHEVVGAGPPYNLVLPSPEKGEMARLEEPVPVRYGVLDGKHVASATVEAELVLMGRSGAVLRTCRSEGLLSNLKIAVPPGTGLSPTGADIYAKVVERDAAGGTVTVRFTSLPPSLQDLADVALVSRAF